MSYHKQNHTCSACAYPAARTRKCTCPPIQTTGPRRSKTEKAPAPAEPNTLKKYPESTRTKSKVSRADLIVIYLNNPHHHIYTAPILSTHSTRRHRIEYTIKNSIIEFVSSTCPWAGSSRRICTSADPDCEDEEPDLSAPKPL